MTEEVGKPTLEEEFQKLEHWCYELRQDNEMLRDFLRRLVTNPLDPEAIKLARSVLS